MGLDFHDRFTLGVPYYNPHAFGAHVVVVEVDKETGEVKIITYVAVHDCGRIINPLIVDGQVHGAIAQGIGQALMEGMVYSPAHGDLAFTVPLFDEFMVRAIPDFRA